MKKIFLLFIFIISILPSYGQIYIRKGSNKYNSTIEYRYDESTNFIREGQSPTGNIIYYKDKQRIRIGKNITGRVKYFIDGKFIRKGDNKNGEIVYVIDGIFIRKGMNNTGPIVYVIDKKIKA